MTAIRNEYCSHPSATLDDKLLEISIEEQAQRAIAYMEHGATEKAKDAIEHMQALRNARNPVLAALVTGKPQLRFTLPPEGQWP